MTTKIRAPLTLALALAASFAVSTAFAQAPAQAPAKAATPSAPAAAPAGTKVADDILDTAAKAGNFKTLAKLLNDTDLTKVLKGKGPFTVFAPTDEAFAKLTKEQLDTLLTPKYKSLLVSMLGAHVLVNKTLKTERMIEAKAFSAQMRNNSFVSVDAKDPKAIKFGGALVTKANIEASNGVIHVIDTVYQPKRVRAALYTIDKAQKTKAAAGPALEKAKDLGGKAVEKAKDLGGKAVDATKDAAGKAVDKAKEMTAPATVPAPK
jgi:uncharacterized surface protein with fasciclin (FAS1) repeats